MNNFEFEHNGEKLWYSRSLAVALYLFTVDKHGKVYILINHRGQGCEFNKGLWNVPGGFIDFDEDALECAERECFEETGFKVNLTDIVGEHYAHPCLFHLDTNPKTHPGRQTMVVIYRAEVPWDVAMSQELTWKNSEPGEVDDIRWLPVELIHSKKFTRGQEKTINQLIEVYYPNYEME